MKRRFKPNQIASFCDCHLMIVIQITFLDEKIAFDSMKLGADKMYLYNIAKKWYLGQLVVFLVKYGSAKQQRNGLLSKWDWKLGDLAIVDLSSLLRPIASKYNIPIHAFPAIVSLFSIPYHHKSLPASIDYTQVRLEISQRCNPRSWDFKFFGKIHPIFL